MIGSRISLVWVGSLRLKGLISRSLTTMWAMILTKGLSGPHSGLVVNLLMYSKPIISDGTDCELVG